MSDSVRPNGLWATRLLCPWHSPGKNPGEGCHCLLQGIFLDQGSNLGLLPWQADSLPLSHPGSPQRGGGWVLLPSSQEEGYKPSCPTLAAVSSQLGGQPAAVPGACLTFTLPLRWQQALPLQRLPGRKSSCELRLTFGKHVVI